MFRGSRAWTTSRSNVDTEPLDHGSDPAHDDEPNAMAAKGGRREERLPSGRVTTERSDPLQMLFEHLEALLGTESGHPSDEGAIHPFGGQLVHAAPTLRSGEALHAGYDSGTASALKPGDSTAAFEPPGQTTRKGSGQRRPSTVGAFRAKKRRNWIQCPSHERRRALLGTTTSPQADPPALEHLGVDAHVVVTVGRAQSLHHVDIASARRRVHAGGRAARNARRESGLAPRRSRGPSPPTLDPGQRAFEVEVGAETQRGRAGTPSGSRARVRSRG